MVFAVGFCGLALLVGGIALLPNVRRGAVRREAEKVARAAYPAQPGEDWPTLWVRLNRRHISGWVGSTVAMAALAAALPAMSDDTVAGGAGFLGFLVVATGRTTGTIVGHLRSLRPRPGEARLVTLHRRELRDYLVPGEAVLLRLAPSVPVATIVFGVALSSVDAVPQVQSLGLVIGGALGLAVGLLAVPLARRVLTAPAGATTPGGLVWAEVLRAMTLRDICAGMWSLAAGGCAISLMPLVMEGDVPRWVIVPGAGIGLAAATVILGLAWVSASDINHQWARRHALAGVA